jgi:hypothetical protein
MPIRLPFAVQRLMPGPMDGKGETRRLWAAEEDFFARHWRLWVAVFWVATAALLLYGRWNLIQWFALSDTDDNMRMMQVRALLAGQDWYDLRQYRLSPPEGANIHWSRIVDLPIAAIMLVLRPLVGGQIAEKTAVAIAPMLPMAIAMFAIAVTTRRLVSPKAFALGVALLLCAHSARGMWSPLRIDHHGWQLAMLSLAIAGLADPKRARGGALLGIATALSLSIGLELLVYLAAAGAAVAVMWMRDPLQGRRLATYGASLAGGCALGYLVFASNDNRLAVCDALSPVWLSVMMVAGAVAVVLPMLPLKGGLARLGAGAACGAAIAAGYALAWPYCLGRLEGVSPELQKMWLDNVREARPIYRHNVPTIVGTVTLPIIGLIGYAATIWRLRRDEAALTPWAVLGTLAFFAASLLLWQSRAGSAAQLLAVPGATALGWLFIPRLLAKENMLLRAGGTVAVFALVSGLAFQNAVDLFPQKPRKSARTVNRANNSCPTLAALRPIARIPKGDVLTFLDLNPRLITVTHHNAVAGPYHRNQQGIYDVQMTWRGSEANALRTVQKRNIDYVLICPGLSESTLYSSEARQGFYMQLVRGKVPAWLEPVPLPKDSPYRMWRVRR